MSAAASPSSPRRRRLPLRFSLRVLLVAFTAFAVGFPIWYRWPYIEEELVYPMRKGQPDRTLTPHRKVVTTWRRTWGGGKVKEGPQSSYRPADGAIVSVTYFQNDERHGPYFVYSKGRVYLTGRYEHDKKEGPWVEEKGSGSPVVTMTWHEDLLDGLYEVREGDDVFVSNRFSRGRITHVGDRPVASRLLDLLAREAIDSPQIVKALNQPTKIQFVETPLKDAFAFLGAQHEVPLLLDSRIATKRETFTANIDGLDLASAVIMLTAPLELGCDYRYGCIWITSAEDAKGWHDPTGVAEIKPPQDSQLARSWNEPVTMAAVNQPLADVLAKLIQPLAIGVDTSQVSADESASKYSVTQSLNGLPFKHVLGILLYDTRCHCELQGETLVILPPK